MKIKGFILVVEIDKGSRYIAISDIIGIRSHMGDTLIERKNSLVVEVRETVTEVAKLIEEAAND